MLRLTELKLALGHGATAIPAAVLERLGVGTEAGHRPLASSKRQVTVLGAVVHARFRRLRARRPRLKHDCSRRIAETVLMLGSAVIIRCAGGIGANRRDSRRDG
jgi:hypothetical protein